MPHRHECRTALWIFSLCRFGSGLLLQPLLMGPLASGRVAELFVVVVPAVRVIAVAVPNLIIACQGPRISPLLILAITFLAASFLVFALFDVAFFALSLPPLHPFPEHPPW